MRYRHAVAAPRQIRRLCRLLELSRLRLYPPLGEGNGNGEAEAGETATRCSARIPTPARRSPCAPAASAPMSSAAKARKPKRSSLPKGWTADIDRPREGAGPAVAAPRCRQASRNRQDDLGRPRPLRAVRAARRHLRQSRFDRGRVLDRPQPRRLGASPKSRPRAARAARRNAGGAQGARRASGRRRQVTVRDGRYGPYVNLGKINATLPKGKDPMSVTMEEALALDRRKAQGRRKGRRRRPKAQEAGGEEGRREEEGLSLGAEAFRQGKQRQRRRRPTAKGDFRPTREEVLAHSSTKIPTRRASARSPRPSR